MNEERNTNYEANEEIIDSCESTEEISPEISEVEITLCRFCKREINPEFEFCTYCGKSQKEAPVIIMPPEEKKENTTNLPPRQKKKKKSGIVFLVLSITSFAIAFLLLISGINSIFTAQISTSSNLFGNIFGSSDNSAILLAILNSVTSLLMSLIFTVVGAFFEIIRRMK